MDGYKIGDKFFIEIESIQHISGDYCAYRIKGLADMVYEESLNRLQPYHEPTPEEHAKALQEHCEGIYKSSHCWKGCVFNDKENKRCKLNTDEPLYWDLEQKPELTEEEIEILEFWKNQRCDFVECDGLYLNFSGAFPHGKLERPLMLFRWLKKDKKYNIDDLLKGE